MLTILRKIGGYEDEFYLITILAACSSGKIFDNAN